ncbi:sodium-coupled monocarboxylate transporter 1 isoform X8 [Polyergus mexicanus]|uniref:sodium-coupled monocarboxylate transporter 1 isoform X8 n=1 Tax=Polyergus mexicanus TaxID=615972 RepID=UPI0038B676E2
MYSHDLSHVHRRRAALSRSLSSLANVSSRSRPFANDSRKNGGCIGKRVFPLDRLAGVCTYASRVYHSRLIALQKGAKVEHARLPARRKKLRTLSRVRFSRCQGGIRAVVWTDALQVGVMIAAAISVTALGTYQMGGMSEIWKKAVEAGRIEFLNFDPSPYTRHTVWTVLIGSWLYCTAYIAVNQTMVQRYKSLESTKKSQLSIAIFTITVMMFNSICCWCGLVLLAWWLPPKCDPRVSGLITADDQLLPAYVMEIAGDLHGIPGLFISGVFGAALSSLSVGFNSTSVVILEDFVMGCFKMKLSDRCSTIFVKILVVFFGLLALSFLFLIEKLGGILSVTNSLAAIAAGTSFGVFTLGILFPWANSKGAFIGAIAGFMMSGWVSFGANAAIGSGLVVPKKLPVSSCTEDINNVFINQSERSSEDNVFPLYRLSYHWVAPIGTLVVLVIGGLVTWITGARDPSSIDKNLLSPVIHRWLPRQKCQNDVNELCMSVPTDPQISANLSVIRQKCHPNIFPQREEMFMNKSS